jgi:hypothetical protein
MPHGILNFASAGRCQCLYGLQLSSSNNQNRAHDKQTSSHVCLYKTVLVLLLPYIKVVVIEIEPNSLLLSRHLPILNHWLGMAICRTT